MAPRKRTSAVRPASESDSEEDVKPKAKRQSTSASKVAEEESSNEPEASGTGMQKNEQGEQYMKLSESRRLTVRVYNKKVLVDMREYYKDKTTGEQKPGSKGISLNKEQWELLKENMGAIDEAVAKMEGDSK